MREKYGNEAPPEVAHLTPSEAWAYGFNTCLNRMMRGMPEAIVLQREASPEVSPDD